MDTSRIDQLKAWLDSHRPLPPALVSRLHDDIVLRWTFHSNAIEGNTLTLLETKVVLEGVTIGGKLMREHFEAINHRDAILYVEEIVKGGEPFSEWQIRNIHQLILKGIDDDNAGKYRNVNVTIGGARHVPPDHLQVSEKMAAFVAWYEQGAAALHPVERAARVHADFVGIHPFIDGNGRTARLLMNLELMKAGYPPAVLPVARRLDYYKALDKLHVDGQAEPFIELIAEFAEEAFAPYRHALGETS
jgi:Fic family protein